MQYPGLPNNRLIVNGVDLSTEYGMILLDGYTLSPPEPKTYTVDIPGGDGVIDLTEGLTGDVAYNNREQEFTFAIIDVDNWERSKTMISNFIHGRLYDYKMTMDPEYTYHGRFTVEEYGHAALTRAIPVLDCFFSCSHKGLLIRILDLSHRSTIRLMECLGIGI